MLERVSAEELLEAAEAGRLRIPVEVGAFIVLRAVEQLSTSPRAFSPGDLLLGGDGSIDLRPSTPSGERDAVGSATQLLKRVLLASAGASPSALLRWLERSGEPSLGLEAMRDEVEAALVPLNREAATRLLARFIRSSALLRQASPSPHDDGSALDAELDRVLEGDAPARGPIGGAGELVAAQLSERETRSGPGLALTLVVIALAALAGLALSHPDLLGLG